jgi:dTDP-4-dehydrorhamnose reductase
VRLLVLGAGGQLGGDLAAAAARRGVAVRGAGRAQADLADEAALAAFLAAEPFDALVNCAALVDVEAIEGEPGPALAVNGRAVGVIAAAAAAKGARLVQISTDYVFGGDAGRTAPLGEAAPPAPVNAYGLSKLLGETLARLGGGDVTVFRVASVFGPRGARGQGGNFVETMLRLGRERGRLAVVADQVMSPTSSLWAAEAILDFLERGGPAGVYHATNSGAVSWFDFARAIVARAGVAAEVTPMAAADWPGRARRPAWSALDNTKLARVIGPIPSWEDALEGYLAARPRA